MPFFDIKYAITFSWDDREDIIKEGKRTFEADSENDAYDVVEDKWEFSMESDWVNCSDIDFRSLSCINLDIIEVKEVQETE